jgi:hypothetical protein
MPLGLEFGALDRRAAGSSVSASKRGSSTTRSSFSSRAPLPRSGESRRASSAKGFESAPRPLGGEGGVPEDGGDVRPVEDAEKGVGSYPKSLHAAQRGRRRVALVSPLAGTRVPRGPRGVLYPQNPPTNAVRFQGVTVLHRGVQARESIAGGANPPGKRPLRRPRPSSGEKRGPTSSKKRRKTFARGEPLRIRIPSPANSPSATPARGKKTSLLGAKGRPKPHSPPPTDPTTATSSGCSTRRAPAGSPSRSNHAKTPPS